MSDEVVGGVARLAARYGLPDEAADQLVQYAEMLRDDPRAPTTVRQPRAIVEVHLGDSLVALELDQVRRAEAVADIGSGAGLPGLPLAAALPGARVILIESSRRKVAFLKAAIASCGFANVEIVSERVESWRDGAGSCDLATARALAPLGVVAEWAAPLLRIGGHLAAWRGKREPQVERQAAQAAQSVGLCVGEVRAVQPFADAEHRHLHLMSKVSQTPPRFPRRPGVARKRPLGSH